MALGSVVTSVVSWLRDGYPEGVPEHDYLPLFALLGRQLSDADVHQIATELAEHEHPESSTAIREAIAAVTQRQVGDADVARVRSRLAAGGWPLAPMA